MPSQVPPFAIRPLAARDLSAAVAIQLEVYPRFLAEDLAAFAGRLAVVPSYCLAATRDEALVGYLLAHAWQSAAPSAIGAVLGGPAPREVLFIHDLAIALAGRGGAIGHALVERTFALAAADGLPRAELIAVEGAETYWRGLGFTEPMASPDLAAKVAEYGPAARWMERTLRAE